MLLKRHRDGSRGRQHQLRSDLDHHYDFAAHAYDGEEDIADALLAILTNMERYIERDPQTRALIRNPIDPMENFADKWAEFPRRERAFYAWLQQARQDFGEAAGLQSSSLITDALSKNIGVELAKELRAGSQLVGLPSSRGDVSCRRRGSGAVVGSAPRMPTKPKGFA